MPRIKCNKCEKDRNRNSFTDDSGTCVHCKGEHPSSHPKRIDCISCGHGRYSKNYPDDSGVCRFCQDTKDVIKVKNTPKGGTPYVSVKKCCDRCGKNKNAPSFRLNDKTCNNCIITEIKKDEAIIKHIESKTHKTCSSCKIKKSVDQFHKGSHKGYQSCCKICQNSKVVAHQKNNPEWKKKHAGYVQKWFNKGDNRQRIRDWHNQRTKECHPLYIGSLITRRVGSNIHITKDNVDNYPELMSEYTKSIKQQRKVTKMVTEHHE